VQTADSQTILLSAQMPAAADPTAEDALFPKARSSQRRSVQQQLEYIFLTIMIE
jgi:hypothetical protein